MANVEIGAFSPEPVFVRMKRGVFTAPRRTGNERVFTMNEQDIANHETGEEIEIISAGQSKFVAMPFIEDDIKFGQIFAELVPTGIRLTWSPLDDIESYNIYESGIYLDSTDSTTYTHATSDAREYTYYFIPVDQNQVGDAQFGDASESVSITISSNTEAGRLDVNATNASIVINNGNPINYGISAFPLIMNWLDGDGNYSGSPPVEGLKIRNNSGDEIGTATFQGNGNNALGQTNIYSITIPNWGPETNLWLTYGENPALADQIQANYDTGITLAAVSQPVAPPVSSAVSSIQGYGTDSSFSRNLSAGTSIAFITNLNDSGAGSAREAFTRSDQRYIVPLVSGIVTLESTITSTGEFSYQGETGQILFRKLPALGDTTIRMSDANQLIRHGIFSMGQTTRSTETSNRCMTLINRNQVVHQCTLPFGVDDALDCWFSSNNRTGSECTISYNILGPNLFNGYNGVNNRGKGMLFGDTTFDQSIHNNLFFLGKFRAPECRSQFAEFKNNLIFRYEWPMFFTKDVSKAGGVSNHSNVIKNLLISDQATFDNKPEWNFLVNSGSSAYPSKCYADGNGYQISNGSIQNLAPNRNNNAPVIANAFTSSPITGNALPQIPTTELSALEAHILANAGSHSHNSDAFRNEIINRVTARNYEIFDGVGGDSRWPTTYAGNQRNLWPTWPNASGNGTFASSFDINAVNGVPNSYRASIGVANDTDLTKTSAAGDGIPDFERFLESVTGVAPW